MKTILPFLVLCFIGLTMNAQEFKFVTESIDYGKVSQGSEGTRTFEFTNIGDAPLIITGVQSTCGCAIPKKPEKPIMPGEKGQIQVSYDTSRMGGFSKAVTIISNAKQSRKMIKIKGFVSKEKLNKEKV
ncbi:DUF1573 domain-containing protein [Tenacibaculum aiptasiae]|uniref:DUF1573 domain-containing protein n=1 Tax=Tenacibaculum aiptasiae TaxID=426481 RepID=UPI00232FFCBC|nr:DUF1573 domain-containing protein [Tenacibaculum aiptasiae]